MWWWSLEQRARQVGVKLMTSKIVEPRAKLWLIMCQWPAATSRSRRSSIPALFSSMEGPAFHAVFSLGGLLRSGS